MRTFPFMVVLFFSFNFGSTPLFAQNGSSFTPEMIVDQEREVPNWERKEFVKNHLSEFGKTEQDQGIIPKKEITGSIRENMDNKGDVLENKKRLTRGEELQIFSKDHSEPFHWGGEKNQKKYYDQRTTSFILIAIGFNNVNEDLKTSDFKILGSRFFEIGWVWKTRVFNTSNWLRLRYGFSFQFNGLKPVDNRYFVENEGLTGLEEFPTELDKSKFRMDNFVFPLHFEFGPSEKSETDSSLKFYTYRKFKIGLGGYAGMNLGVRQKLRYKEGGEWIKRKMKGDFNTNDFIYGISGYVGIGGTSLYLKYDLNPIFKDPNAEMRNISAGLRFDLD